MSNFGILLHRKSQSFGRIHTDKSGQKNSLFSIYSNEDQTELDSEENVDTMEQIGQRLVVSIKRIPG